MTDDRERNEDADIVGVVRTLRRRWRLVAFCWVLVVGAAAALTLTQTKEYSAKAGLLFRDPGLDQKLFSTTYLAPNRDPAREGATNVKLVSLIVVGRKTAERLGDITPEQVSQKVRAEAEGQSDVVSVIATDRRPAFARVLANAYAEEYITFRRVADRAKIAEAQRLVRDRLAAMSPTQRASAEGRSLSERADQLEILASLQTGNAELVQYARTPTRASSPRVKRNLALAVLVGALLAAGAGLLRDRLDRRIREPEELESTLGLPVLGVVPQSAALSAGRGLDATASHVDLPLREGEAFRMLRARMRYFNVDRQVRTVIVTSASAGEGKTTVAVHLAATAASIGGRVLLIEADLRRPTIGRTLGLDAKAGLSEVLAHTANLEAARRTITVSNSGVQSEHPPSFDLLPAGFPPPNPTELLESQSMRDMIEHMSAEYDLVLIDTPPLLVVSDAIPLIRRVDGVVIVSRLGTTLRGAATHLVTQLRGLNAPTLGVVANGMRGRSQSYNYNYNYNYASASAKETADV